MAMTPEDLMVIAAWSTFGIAALALFFALTTSKTLNETQDVLEKTQETTKSLVNLQAAIKETTEQLHEITDDLTLFTAMNNINYMGPEAEQYGREIINKWKRKHPGKF